MKVWRNLDIITLDHLSIMQEKVDNMIPPPKVGGIPRKIQSGFVAFTADEWKNWIILYSPYCVTQPASRESLSVLVHFC